MCNVQLEKSYLPILVVPIPFVVFTHPPRDYMSDHEATSLLVRNACFNASIPNYSTLNRAQPSSAIPYLIYAHPLEGIDIFGRKVKAQFYVDTSSSFNRKLGMLACHESQREWLRIHHGMDEYLESVRRWSVETGQLASTVSGRIVAHAEAFIQHLGHSYPRENILKEMLGGKVIAATLP
jgi:LmbE family N-acetylglucosaminyl deacetylase